MSISRTKMLQVSKCLIGLAVMMLQSCDVADNRRDMLCGNWDNKLSKKGAFVTINTNAKYTLSVKPISVSKKGDNTNECYILDEDGNALVKFQISGSGGHWGSMSNLWGDGYEDAAKSLASFILKCFK